MVDVVICNVDLDVVCIGVVVCDLEWFERFVVGVGVIGMNLYGVFCGLFVDG